MWRRHISDDGDTIVRRRIDPTEGRDFMWNTPFVLDPNDNAKMYVAGGKIVWRNNDLDEIPMDNSDTPTMINWDSLSNTRVTGDARISIVAVSKSPANVLYYGTTHGEVYKITDADKGDPIPELVYTDGANTSNVGSIAIDPNDANKVIIVYTNYRVESMLYTEDGGKNWIPVGGNLEENIGGSGNGPAVAYAKYLPRGNGDRIFVGTSTGVYSTSYLNGYNTVWQPEAQNVIGNVVVDMIDARESDGLVVVGTHATGIYQAYINDLHPQPNMPNLLSPYNGSKGIAASTLLQWKSNNPAALYDLQVATDKDFNNIIFEKSYIKNDFEYVGGLEQGGKTYYWRIKTYTAGGETEFTEAWTFKTAPESPELIFPAKSQKELDTDITFLWSEADGATRYNLQIATMPGFTGIIKDTIVTGTSCLISGFELNSKYYWKVASGDEDGIGELSKQNIFYTKDPNSVKEGLEGSLVLYQNYPNPFSKTTHIEFDSKYATHVLLDLYDANGRKIETLLDKMVYGRNKVDIDAYNLKSGTYYYRLTASGKTFTKKMVVVK
jgi:hypothetical protein